MYHITEISSKIHVWQNLFLETNLRKLIETEDKMTIPPQREKCNSEVWAELSITR